MITSGIGLHIPGSKRSNDDEEEGEEGGEPSLLGPGLLGKLDPTSRKKPEKPADIQFQDPKVIKAAIRLQRVCRPVKQGPSFSAQLWQPLPARGRVLLSPPAPPPARPPPRPHSPTAAAAAAAETRHCAGKPDDSSIPSVLRNPISPPRPTG